MSQPRDVREKDLPRPALEAIIDHRHPLPVLACKIDWALLEKQLGSVYKPGAGHPPLPIRVMADFVDPQIRTFAIRRGPLRSLGREPIFPIYRGEQVFHHELRFDRSPLTRWRQRLGEERLAALLQESLRVPHSNGALATKDLERVVVHRATQNHRPPPRPRLAHKAIEKLGRFCAQARHRVAAKLSAGGQTRCHHSRP